MYTLWKLLTRLITLFVCVCVLGDGTECAESHAEQRLGIDRNKKEQEETGFVVLNKSSGSVYHIKDHGLQFNVCGCGVVARVPAECRGMLRGILHAILAAGISDGQAGVFRHLPSMLVPGARRGQAGHGDAGAVWALRLVSGHPEHGVAHLHGDHGHRLRSAAARGAHSADGMLRVRTHLPHCGTRGGGCAVRRR